MKNLAFFLLIFNGILLSSCSQEQDATPINKVDETDYFTYSAFETPVEIATWNAVLRGEMFEVVGELANGDNIIFNFNRSGNLAYAMYDPDSETLHPILKSPYEYSSHYFDFSIVAIDTERKIIKVSFAGNLYEQEFNLESHSTPIEGVFNVHYTETAAEENALSVKAKIENEMWYGVKKAVTISDDIVIIDVNSDDDMKIVVQFNSQSLSTNTYNFTSSSENKVSLSRYNVATQSYDDYESEGTLVVTEITPSALGQTISGNFTFDAPDAISGLVYHVRTGTFSVFVAN